jgi:hypothetical protein
VKSILGCMSHQATISVAVLDSTGKVVMESILETKAATVLGFLRDCAELYRRPWAAWLYDLLKPHIDVVCNPRKNVLLKDGNKSDRIDGRKLAELLRGNQLGARNQTHRERTGVPSSLPFRSPSDGHAQSNGRNRSRF